MSFWKNAGQVFLTQDHTDKPVAHTGRSADILRVVVKALEDVKDLTSGKIEVDFGATEATARVQKNFPRIKFA